MQPSDYPKSAWMTLLLVLTFAVGWELYWRHENTPLSYNDDESMWASQRKLVYESSPARPVVIGSSRIKFDLDLATWARLAGQKPIQLAVEGTSPRPMLTDLGNDPNFRGTLLVDVTELLFFTPDGSFPEKEATKRVKAYPNWSLSQQVSFWINHVLESQLRFLDSQDLALNPLLNLLPIPNRAGVWGGPTFPRLFTRVGADRQTKMTDQFVVDTSMQNQVKKMWLEIGAHSPKKAIDGPPLTAIIASAKRSVEQIRTRGGQVLFIRTPCGGPFFEIEKQMAPRNLYWDRLLSETHAPGIYFEDYPALSHFHFPEWSHLSPTGAVVFTKAVYPIIARKLAEAGQPQPTATAAKPASSTL